jgi:hypothetical protein
LVDVPSRQAWNSESFHDPYGDFDDDEQGRVTACKYN